MDESMDNNVHAGDLFPMINYEKQMFLDILEHDGLMICAKGFNEHVVILNLLRAFADPSNLVLVINSADYEEKYLMAKLKLPPLPILSAEREKAYLKGGVYFVSTRVLVVELLRNRVPVEHVTGIVVLRAHSILESCQETFVLRLYRQKNKTGFIKGFSHSAERFTFGYAHVEKVMRNLFVKELFLWPRFHASVKQDLEQVQCKVIELHVPLSNKTTLIQSCILDIMNYTSKELKRINRNLDLQEITVENCLIKKFHKILQTQLDTVWHQLSNRTKELIQDLKIMRSLIISLIHQDAVSFYSLVGKYRSPEYAKVNSGWILLDSAEQLFRYARTRIYNLKKEFEPEVYSKWKYLSEILTVEIPEDQKKKNTNTQSAKILILCNDPRTCKQLNQYLTMGAQAFMYLSALRNELDIPLLSKEYQSFKNTCNIDQTSETRAKKTPANNNDTTAKSTKENELENLFSKDDIDDCDIDKSHFMLTMSQAVTEKLTGETSKINESKDETLFESFTQMENMDLTHLDLKNPLICIQTFKSIDGGVCLEDTLRQLRPNYVIMYHSDITATRQIELYAARKDSSFPSLTVYILVHANTTEEQAYLTSLKREKEAFELLIQAKSTMVVPSYQDGKTEIPVSLEIHEPEEPGMNTRKAGGQEENRGNQGKPRVIVDIREFRSDLPALLHKKGIETEPVTITIGDYILTPDICVERKSLSDLIGSLNSGRLYTQCTQMCRNYSRPMLLIEFDQNRPFQLQGHYVVSNDISGADIQQKLQLLTLHFPRLKLIWSPSPYATADLFFELKHGRPQPIAADALALGEEAGVDTLLIERFNPRIHDFLLKLPGVNSKNISRLMNRGISMDNLIKLEKNELDEILGNKIDAEMLWTMLHSTHKPMQSSNDTKITKKNRFGKAMRGKKY